MYLGKRGCSAWLYAIHGGEAQAVRGYGHGAVTDVAEVFKASTLGKWVAWLNARPQSLHSALSMPLLVNRTGMLLLILHVSGNLFE